MWEIPFYLIMAPIFTLLVTLICSIKLQKYLLGPVIIFLALNIPTFILPFIFNIGWEAIFGWAVFYTMISIITSLSVRFAHNRKKVA